MTRYISATEIMDYLQCRLRHYYGYERRLETLAPTKTAPMRVGLAVHAALEGFHSLKPEGRSEELLVVNFDMAWAELRDGHIKGGGEYDEKKWATSRNNGHKMLRHFWKRFGTDEEMHPLEVEKRFERGLSVEPPVTLVGIADAVMLPSEGRLPLIHELKTSASSSYDPSRWLYLHPQHKILAYAAGYETCKVVYTLLGTGYAGRQSVVLKPHVYAETARLVHDVAFNILAGERVEPLPSEGAHCMRCKYSAICIGRVVDNSAEGVIQSNYRVREAK